MPADTVDARLLKAHQKLIKIEKKFVPQTKGRPPIDPEAYNNWFTCVVVSMLAVPSTRSGIRRNAIRAGELLGLETIDHYSKTDNWSPCWHMGEEQVRKYFLPRPQGRGVKKRSVGDCHTFNDFNLYCQTHDLSWNVTDSLENTANCTRGCKYGFREP